MYGIEVVKQLQAASGIERGNGYDEKKMKCHFVDIWFLYDTLFLCAEYSLRNIKSHMQFLNEII